MNLIKYLVKRFLYLIPQLLVITAFTFWIVRMLPGNPAYQLAGPFAPPESIRRMEARLGLDKPIYVQYWMYLNDLARGDLGNSWFTGRPVWEEFSRRVPATLELTTISLLIMIVLGVAAGILTALNPRGFMNKLSFIYGMLSGSLPDFWLGLILIFVFFFLLGWFPGPVGRIGINIEAPKYITGMFTFDSLLTGNWEALRSSLAHLVLPVTTLVIVYMGAIVKMQRSSLEEVLKSNFVSYAKASGLSKSLVMRYALRNSLLPVVTMIGITYGYLLGGAVLVEQVFAWGGLGQYAVKAVSVSDYIPVQGFVLLAAVFNMLVYLVVDIVYFILDPRLKI